MTPEMALQVIRSQLRDLSRGAVGDEIDSAISVLASFVARVQEHGSVDLEWGDAGDCRDRLENDGDVARTLQIPGGLAADDLSDGGIQEAIRRNQLGRHYGDPHCIWCLQAG